MTVIRKALFRGEATGVTPRLIPEGYAQKLLDANVRKGTLRPVRENLPTAINTGRVDPETIFRYPSGHWLSFAGDVDVVRSPLADDAWERIYWTGDGVPKMAAVTNATSGVAPYPNTHYELGVPAPDSILAVTGSGGDEPDTVLSAVYAYSYVTGFEEEGPLSGPSTIVNRWDIDETGNGWVDLTIPSINVTGRNITKVRIYRSEDGGEYNIVADVVAGTGIYRDSVGTSQLLLTAVSIEWDIPNPAMIGLSLVPGGGLAGFFDNVLCFSEPGYPHAWPIAYRITLPDDIVGIAVSAVGIVVCTKGMPWLVVGSTPSAMDAVKIETPQACVSKRSIVDMGDYVIYASPDGLVAIGAGGADIITKNVLDRDVWKAGKPESLHAYRESDRYVGFYKNSETQSSFAFSAERGFELMSGWASAAFYDAQLDTLYLTNGSMLDEFDGGSYREFTYRSGIDEVQPGTSFSCIKVIADSYPIPVSMYADGVLAFTVPVISNVVQRLPAGFNYAREWEVEVKASVEVFSIQVASSPSELV
ncbi:MAG: hypothetical protein ACKVJE_17470 [Pseudomonadales bacterium]